MEQSLYNNRKGMSTVLGILLMSGILFTSIIPLFMYVNNVNNYYDRKVTDMKILDQEKGLEELQVYAYGHNDTSTRIDVFIANTGSMPANISRIWIINRTLTRMKIFNYTSMQLTPGEQTTIFELNPGNVADNTYFNVEVVTTRGNKYASYTNALHWVSLAVGWEYWMNEYIIQVLIVKNNWGNSKYTIVVTNATDETGWYYYQVQSPNVAHGSFFNEILTKKAGVFNVTAYSGTILGQKLGSYEVTLTWTHPVALRKFYEN